MIACGSHELSIPFPSRFLPESKLWNRKVPPWQLGVAPYAVLPRSQQCPQTSIHDRFALATQGFRSASSLLLGRGHRCQFQSHTSESPSPARYKTDCSERGTNGTVRHSAEFSFRLQTECRARAQLFGRRVISLGRRGERFVRESAGLRHPQ